ncbi:3-phosphoglycerate kinase [Tanacetum coccineum]
MGLSTYTGVFKATDPFNEKWQALGLSLHPRTSLHLHCFYYLLSMGPIIDLSKEADNNESRNAPHSLWRSDGENEIVSGEAGYLHKLEQCYPSIELDYLDVAVSNTKRPFAAIVGDSKVSSKIGVIESLLEKHDILLSGGDMIFTFYKAQDLSVGSSLVEEDKLDLATTLLAKAKGFKITICKQGKQFVVTSPDRRIRIFWQRTRNLRWVYDELLENAGKLKKTMFLCRLEYIDCGRRMAVEKEIENT